MRMPIRHLLVISAVVATTLFGVGCGAADEIEAIENCASVCDKYNECIDDIDVSECTDQCEDMADSDAAMSALDQCDNCIDSKDGCVEAAACVPQCPFIPTPEE